MDPKGLGNKSRLGLPILYSTHHLSSLPPKPLPHTGTLHHPRKTPSQTAQPHNSSSHIPTRPLLIQVHLPLRRIPQLPNHIIIPPLLQKRHRIPGRENTNGRILPPAQHIAMVRDHERHTHAVRRRQQRFSLLAAQVVQPPGPGQVQSVGPDAAGDDLHHLAREGRGDVFLDDVVELAGALAGDLSPGEPDDVGPAIEGWYHLPGLGFVLWRVVILRDDGGAVASGDIGVAVAAAGRWLVRQERKDNVSDVLLIS